MFNVIVKLAAIFVLFGVCYALPVEKSEDLKVTPTSALVPLEPTPGRVEDSPKLPKPDNSDLKTDATSWWRSWHHREYPVYYYSVYSVPRYSYWKSYY